jgi:flavin reductase (DIM6/NTAB) family NADH-FMN oxidoreductase RutF
MSWKTITPKELQENPFKLIGDDWTLVTAGTPQSWNTLTASWGGLGILWSRPVSFVFVRPTRHTFSFLEASPRFTLSFFDESWRQALRHIGTVSGRDHDKAAETGLVPHALGEDVVTFEQARLVIVHRKLHAQDLDPASFVDPSLEGSYPSRDYHRFYVGEIEKILVRED